jgi:hypothetical protein
LGAADERVPEDAEARVREPERTGEDVREAMSGSLVAESH